MRGLRRIASLALALVSAAAVARAEAPVRVGLVVDATGVTVGSQGMQLMLTSNGEAVGSRLRQGPLRFGLRGEASAARPQYMVRITVEQSRKKAEIVRDALDPDVKAPLKVDRAGQAYGVFAGPFDDEARAKAVLASLTEVGMTDAVLVRPEAPASSRLVVVTGGYDVVPIPAETARVATTDGAPLPVDGKSYRGEIEVFVNARGMLTVVDEVPLEDYLRGVVPAEMGPEQYPMPEALKAQAIAARTYALMPPAHADEGFDRCDGPHCQAYGGVSSEHPMTDRAVSETAGMVISYGGAPAHAYFSSTCGGHTEDVRNVFQDDTAPYLRGVPCYPEKVEFLRIPGRQLSVDFQRVDGRTAHGVFARLIAVGVVTEEEAKLGVFSRRARAQESAEWLRRAVAVAGRSVDEDALRTLTVDTALGFVRSVLVAIGGQGADRLIAAQDLSAASRFRELQGITGDDLTTALLALKAGLLPEGLEPGWAQSHLSRGNVLEIVEGWLHAQGQLDPPPVRFIGAKGGALQVLAGKETRTVPVAPGVMLLSGRPASPQRMRDAVELKLGDKLRLHVDASGQARCIELDEDPDGASLDRLSAHSWWSRRIPMTELSDAAARLGIGSLRDLRVTKVSDAGRVVGLELTDASSSTRELTGFAVRQFLGLPDSRCDLHLERDASGRLVALTATGRGWGHGVGLCQVGAFGMALQGSTATEILKHYYPGTAIERMR